MVVVPGVSYAALRSSYSVTRPACTPTNERCNPPEFRQQPTAEAKVAANQHWMADYPFRVLGMVLATLVSLDVRVPLNEGKEQLFQIPSSSQCENNPLQYHTIRRLTDTSKTSTQQISNI